MTLSLPIRVSAELGKASLSVQEILRLTQGSMIELDNKAKAPLRLVIKDQVVALGEVVLKDEKFAVKVTQIDSLKDRIHKL
jgi:flagellar motor switch protein FliN/FliY